MSVVPIVDNEYITVQYLADKKIIYHVVHKPIADQPLQAALNAGSDALKKNGAHKWLSDDRKNGPLSPEQLEWGLRDWNPRTIAAGWKYWANIVPEEMAAAGTLAPLMDALFEQGLRMMVFTDVDKARQWLDSFED
ncbi:MAG: hypothetical protein KF716_19650 [Anaerolineae bacterium]|nr:hypothetical protein [Anaerolineae bacterium]